MNRHYLKLSLLSFLSLSAIGNVQAANLYMGIQAGKADTDISGANSASIIEDVGALVATTSGARISGGGISGTISNPSFTMTSADPYATSVSDKPVSGRIFFGYQLFPQLAFEVGYFTVRNQISSYTSNANVVTTSNLIVGGTALPATVIYNQIDGKDTYNQNALDLVVKGIYPFNDKFSIYAKLGIAYMKVTTESTVTMSNPTSVVVGGVSYAPGTTSFTNSTSVNSSKGYPTIGIGAAYRVTESLDLDLSWYRIVSETDGVNSINMIYGGLLVRFAT